MSGLIAWLFSGGVFRLFAILFALSLFNYVFGLKHGRDIERARARKTLPPKENDHV